MPGRKQANRSPSRNCPRSSNGRLQAAGLVLPATATGAGVVPTGLQLALAGVSPKVIPAALLLNEIGIFFEKAPALTQAVERSEMNRAAIARLTGVQDLQTGPFRRVCQRERLWSCALVPGGSQVIRKIENERCVTGPHQCRRRWCRFTLMEGSAAFKVGFAAATRATLVFRLLRHRGSIFSTMLVVRQCINIKPVLLRPSLPTFGDPL